MAKDLSMIISFTPDMDSCSIDLVDLDIKVKFLVFSFNEQQNVKPTSKLIEHVQKEALCNKMNETHNKCHLSTVQ